MPITVTRTKTDMIGTPGSPASIPAGATNTSTSLDHTSPAGIVEASIGLTLIMGGTAPTTAITIRFNFSEDGTSYIQDGPDVSLTGVASTTYTFRYDPPNSAWKSQVVIINGATNAITAWCQGSTLAVS